MTLKTPNFRLIFARTDAELQAAQRLRYSVFVTELGANASVQDHSNQIEQDKFDPFADHLLLLDLNRVARDQVVGAYRVLRSDQSRKTGGFYSEAEFDLTPLVASGRKLLELGRSCVHADYRGGTAMYELWTGLASYIAEHQIDVLFGVASFHGTDIAALAEPLSFLHHRHLAPPELCVRAIGKGARKMNILPESQIDRRRAMVATPALIKAYLRLGGCVGQGAWVDLDFNTTDVCLVMDTLRMNERQREIYTKPRVVE